MKKFWFVHFTGSSDASPMLMSMVQLSGSAIARFVAEDKPPEFLPLSCANGILPIVQETLKKNNHPTNINIVINFFTEISEAGAIDCGFSSPIGNSVFVNTVSVTHYQVKHRA